MKQEAVPILTQPHQDIYMLIRETLITYISRYQNLSMHGLSCDILISGILFEI